MPVDVSAFVLDVSRSKYVKLRDGPCLEGVDTMGRNTDKRTA